MEAEGEEMDEAFRVLLKKLYEILKPLGYRKEAANFRFFGADGLCRIINVQRSSRNADGCCEFILNAGVYFEKSDEVLNRKFKEYDCQIRIRADSGGAEHEEWWRLERVDDAEALLTDMKPALAEIENRFARFPTKEETIRMILSGEAEQYSFTNVMHYHTAKLLAEMGYASEVYEAIRDTKTTAPRAVALIELSEQLEKTLREEK